MTELYKGMKLEHKYRRSPFTDPAERKVYDWYCVVNEIDEGNNELKVTVVNENYSHPETWNMAHTISGLNDGEYLEIKV
jgi:hypothetical protein